MNALVEVVAVALPRREAAVLAFVEDYLHAHHRAPLLREIANAVPGTDESAVYRLLTSLELKGALVRDPRWQKRAPVVVAGMPPRDPRRATLDPDAAKALRLVLRRREVTRGALARALRVSHGSTRTLARVEAALVQTGRVRVERRTARREHVLVAVEGATALARAS